MKDRIQKYIDFKGISAGELAEILNVQRSNISHILNGRNKPGAVFLERFLLSFPDINARWLLTGKGDMINGTNKTIESSSKDNNTLQTPRNDNSDNDSLNTGDNVEKVILLHSDGSFSYFTPR